MKIVILTFWYNEEFFAPFFLKHYSFADRILIALDTNTNDRTVEICNKFKNVSIVPFSHSRDGFDPERASFQNNLLNTLFNEGFDWGMALDVDEFIFAPKPFIDIRHFLSNIPQDETVVNSRMYQIYRHIMEGDLDSDKSAILQRQHGDPDMENTYNKNYIKENILRIGQGIDLSIGNHLVYSAHKKSDKYLVGSHWKFADIKHAIERSKELAGSQPASVSCFFSEKEMIEKCEEHSNDPNVLAKYL